MSVDGQLLLLLFIGVRDVFSVRGCTIAYLYRRIDGSNKFHNHARLNVTQLEIVVNIQKLFLRR